MNKERKPGWLKRQICNARAEVASRPEWMKQLREPGWLQTQLDRCSAEVKTWPVWMQRVLREDYSMKYGPLPESILNDLERGARNGPCSDYWILEISNPALLDLIREVREWRQKAQTQADAVRLLENLTPGGSEFAGSPERCAKWVSDFMSSTLQHAATASGERNQLREQLIEERENGQRWLIQSQSIREERETLIASLQSALVVAGHEPDCPVVHGASVDCVVGSGCVDYRAKYEQSQDALGRLLQAVGAVDR